MSDLSMTTEPRPIQARFPQIRAVFYGDYGVGKTTAALTFPRPLVIDTDGGLEGDAVLHIQEGEEWSPEGWRDLNALYFWLKGQSDRYDTLVVDSLDSLVRFLMNEVTATPTRARSKDAWLDSMTDNIPEQRDYLAVAKAMDRFLTHLRQTGKHIVFTAGVREPNVEKGETKRVFDVAPSVQSLVADWANLVGELVVVRDKSGNDRRLLHTRAGDPVRKTKSRWGALLPAVADPTYGNISAGIHSSIDPNTKQEKAK